MTEEALEEVSLDDEDEDTVEVPSKVQKQEEQPKPEVKVAKNVTGEATVTLAEVKDLLNCIKAISGLIAEISIEVKKDGISMTAMDAANVAMVVFNMKPEAFVTYNVVTEGTFGVKLTELKAFLERVKGDAVTIEFGQKIQVSSAGQVKKRFSLAVIELDDQKPQKLPEMNFTTEVAIDTKELADALEDAALVSEACRFKLTDGQFLIEASGDLNAARIEMPKALVQKAQKDSVSRYALEYLGHMVKVNISDKIVFQFGSDYPMKLNYKTGHCTLTFLLAPRVENSD